MEGRSPYILHLITEYSSLLGPAGFCAKAAIAPTPHIGASILRDRDTRAVEGVHSARGIAAAQTKTSTSAPLIFSEAPRSR